MSFIKLAGSIISVFFVIVFLAAAVTILAPFAGWHVDSVLSGSMEPAVPTGSTVILGPVSTDQIRVGDIVAYNHGQVVVCHRVTAIDQGPPIRFTMKGDANKSPDGTLVSPDQVTGRLLVTIPLAGYLIAFVKTPLGLFLIILLPLLSLIGMELKSLISDRIKDDKKRGSE